MTTVSTPTPSLTDLDRHASLGQQAPRSGRAGQSPAAPVGGPLPPEGGEALEIVLQRAARLAGPGAFSRSVAADRYTDGMFPHLCCGTPVPCGQAIMLSSSGTSTTPNCWLGNCALSFACEQWEADSQTHSLLSTPQLERPARLQPAVGGAGDMSRGQVSAAARRHPGSGWHHSNVAAEPPWVSRTSQTRSDCCCSCLTPLRVPHQCSGWASRRPAFSTRTTASAASQVGIGSASFCRQLLVFLMVPTTRAACRLALHRKYPSYQTEGFHALTAR